MIRDAPWPNQTKPLSNLLRTGLIFFDPLVTVLKALIWWLDLIVESRHVSKLLNDDRNLYRELCISEQSCRRCLIFLTALFLSSPAAV